MLKCYSIDTVMCDEITKDLDKKGREYTKFSFVWYGGARTFFDYSGKFKVKKGGKYKLTLGLKDKFINLLEVEEVKE